jgi:hypothetical protein
MNKKKSDHEMTASAFMSLSEKEKSRIYNEIDSMSDDARRAKSRPLTARQQTDWKKLQQKMKQEHRRGRGRPKMGRHGVSRVSVSVEQTLLIRADAYAEAHNLSRSEMFARSLANLIGAA